MKRNEHSTPQSLGKRATCVSAIRKTEYEKVFWWTYRQSEVTSCYIVVLYDFTNALYPKANAVQITQTIT